MGNQPMVLIELVFAAIAVGGLVSWLTTVWNIGLKWWAVTAVALGFAIGYYLSLMH